MVRHPEPALVVGIGASAGGIAALKQFFAHVPQQSGLAYVVILHLSPSHDSQLAAVLQSTAAIPVTQVVAETAVAADHVYVIPPNRSLSLSDGHLTLSPVLSFEERRAPVDIFFRTLAEARHARAVSVILSGTGPNGSMGLKRVKERGGLVIAQDLNEAEHRDMPRNAIATGLVDHVLPVSQIPATLLAYAGSLADGSPLADRDRQQDEQAIHAIVAELRASTGHDFSKYKRGALLRRIERRMIVKGLSHLEAYAACLKEHGEEGALLLRELLISVTNFFRDVEVWAALERTVLPRLFQGKGPDDTVRAWVAACATGEEAYTLGMQLADYAATLSHPPRIQMFATDIDAEALSVGRNGVYSSSDVADVPPERLRRHFVREHDLYRARGELREPVLFAKHNLLKDPPFSSVDLIACRNLLIYLNNAGQERVLETAHFALKPGGWLVLGSSESTSAADDLFVVIDKANRIAQSRPVPKRLTVPARELFPSAPAAAAMEAAGEITAATRLSRSSFLDLHHRLLEAYSAPSMVINEAYDIVHLSPQAGQYLQVPGGEPSRNLLTLIRPELRPELRTAVYQAIQQRTNVQFPGLRLELENGPRNLTLHVRPVLSEADAARGFVLVVFEEVQPSGEGSAPEEVVVAAMARAYPVEDELIAVRAQLRAAVEECEVQAEEFKASAEEQQGLNEELRSVAEELETSKEELQSVNEELTSVNQELKIKIDDLGHANSDIHNLINATDIASVFLDRTLRVKLYTPRARSLFNLIPADVGRPLLDLTNHLVYGDLWREIDGVLEHLQTVEREVETRQGEWYLMRIRPYRSSEDRIDGVVLTFVDITERKRTTDAIEEAHQGLALAQRASDSALWVWDLANDTQQWSPEMCRLRGVGPRQAVSSQHFIETVVPEDRERVRGEIEALLARHGMEWAAEFRVATDRGIRWISERGRVLYEAGRPVRVRGIDLDVTTQRIGEDARARLASIVELSNDAILSFDFGGAIVTWNKAAERLFGLSGEELLKTNVAQIVLPVHGAPDVLRALESGQPIHDFDTTGQTASGRVLELSIAASPVRDSAGRLVGGSMVARDLAPRHMGGRRRYEARSGAAETDLLRQIVAIQEEERTRLARDLHDHFGQELTALRLSLASLKERRADPDEVLVHLEQAEAIAERLDHDVDFLAYELRPSVLDDEGLVAAMQRYLGEWSKRFGVQGNLHTTGLVDQRLSPAIELTLYRITQEALNNVTKHAAARRVDIMLERRDRNAVLIVEDDGRGFDVARAQTATVDHRLGLIGMRERAGMAGGTVDFESSPGHGSTVIVRIPLSDPEQ